MLITFVIKIARQNSIFFLKYKLNKSIFLTLLADIYITRKLLRNSARAGKAAGRGSHECLWHFTILTVPHCTVLYCTVPYCTVMYCTVPHRTVPTILAVLTVLTVLYCAVLYRTVPYRTIPYRTVYCTVPYRTDRIVLSI